MINLSLERLKQVTGVFITESDFQVIKLEYLDFLKDHHYSDSESVAEIFIGHWKEEQELLGTFLETSDKKIKYFRMEGKCEDEVPLTTEGFLDELDMSSYHWENMCRRDWRVFSKIIETGSVDKELLSNILQEETISHEQIYQLQKAMRSRLEELLGN